ncbi:hypothetical protein [Bacillus thuringiensis]|uniref:hypothetical protein n=1 Tax=Bacillus thuringiensis TaxID=1428 RepID=UPI0011A921AB|nr:hypothetical protein [Bacillus thuringiensis]
MIINPYCSYIDLFGQFSNYSLQYLSRSPYLYPLPYLAYHYDYYSDWNYGGGNSEYIKMEKNDIYNSELDRMSWLSDVIEHNPIHPVHSTLCHGFSGYKTNKFELEHSIQNGGWVTAWSQDIAEKDVLQGVVASGVSVFSANPGPFLAWINDLVNRTISSLTTDAQNKFTAEARRVANGIAADVIRQAIQGKNPLEAVHRFGTIDFKAGAIKYAGKNMVCGKTVSTTWGMKPYIALRVC